MRSHRPFALALVASLAAACGTGTAGPGGDPANPEPGSTRFVSADETMGTNANQPGTGAGDDLGAGAPSEDAGDGNGGSDRTVEEGDVYRVLSGGTLLNLNAYRGLQVIDVSNPTAPAVIGRLEVSGTPVELYVSGTTAFVLLNDWVGYWGNREEIRVNTTSGGVILAVDLSDPAHPQITDREVVPGWIYKSRLTRGDGQEALYVVSQEYGYVEATNGSSTTWQTRTKVKSFAAANGALVPASELDLGGWIADIAATPEALLVARYDWYTGNGDRSRVSVIDISNPDGTMIEGDEIETAGLVENQFNMDLDGHVLRVVSGRGWNGSNTNHLQTFDATDIQHLVPIDHDTFGANEDLYGTLFLGNSAFFVTYQRTDPFHAFHIGDDGQAEEMSQFVVSGWNDFFKPAFNDTRIVGIGTNDTSGRTMAVSLYDVTDLTNANPLVARQEVDVDWSWSAASWDHRAFSVLENAVAIPAADGTLETGLVLLPFTGYDQQTGASTAAVQIFTFSNHTLTRRGLMNHGTPVHRSFQPAAGTTANLSQEELSLFATGNADQPQELGRVDLAPNYTDVLVYGSYAVRLKDSDDWYTRTYGSNAAPRPSTVQVIPRNVHPDLATPVASFEVPADAFLKKVGNLLTAITMTPVDTAQWPYVWQTTIRVFDLADPAHPLARGQVTTTDLQPDYGGYYGYYGVPGMADCFDCGGFWPGYYGNGASIYPVGQSLAFVERTQEQESLGQEQVCYAYPRNERSTCYDSAGYTDGCTVYGGGETCITRGGATTCSGDYYVCTWNGRSSSFDCQVADSHSVPVQRNCYDREAVRYWNRFAVQVVDLSHPDAPTVGSELQMPREEQAVGVVTNGTDLWLSYREPTQVPGDPRPYVAYYARPIGLGVPSHPVQGPEINLPGELLAIQGNTLFTRDQVWGQRSIEAAVARLRLQGTQAVLEAHRRFPDQLVETIKLDGAGHVLVSHREGSGYGWYGGGQVSQELTLLDANSSTLDQLASVEVDSWATLRDARAGRALFQVPGGLLVFNLDNATQPWPQAFFATKGWPADFLVEGRSILFAAGRYGLYQFGLDEVNLQTP